MKKRVFFAIMLAVSLASVCESNGQVLQMSPIGKLSYAAPVSTLAVEVSVRKEQIVTGPYARYAQKYFGVIAPLSDKTSYEITAVTLSLADADRRGVAPTNGSREVLAAAPADGNLEFPKVLPDRRSAVALSPENAAAAAAKTIFDIRSRREELIMGDYSDAVFGAGLQTALERLDQMENEYLELFFGKRRVETCTVRYYVTPSAGETNVTVCRYREDSGLLSPEDLAGEPVVLECRPQGFAIAKYPPKRHQRAPKSDEREVAVPDIVNCKVVLGKQLLAETELPLLQYGVRIIVNEKELGEQRHFSR